MPDAMFSIVIQAELMVDVFFWMTGLLGTYFLLIKIDENDGKYGQLWMIYLNRIMRLLPVYMFTLLFFWKFLVLFGGDGPLFFLYN